MQNISNNLPVSLLVLKCICWYSIIPDVVGGTSATGKVHLIESICFHLLSFFSFFADSLCKGPLSTLLAFMHIMALHESYSLVCMLSYLLVIVFISNLLFSIVVRFLYIYFFFGMGRLVLSCIAQAHTVFHTRASYSIFHVICMLLWLLLMLSLISEIWLDHKSIYTTSIYW